MGNVEDERWMLSSRLMCMLRSFKKIEYDLF